MSSDSSDGTLPVELYYFKAEIVTNHILVTWGTATEVDNYGFNLERSTNSIDWIKLEFLPGYGTSNIPRDYSYEDTTVVLNSIYYYRLKQIDIVGSFSYSDTISIQFLTKLDETENSVRPKFYLYQNYPNPFNPNTKIRFEVVEEGRVELIVFDVLGKEVAKLVDNELNPGIFECEFNPSLYSEYSSSVFFYRLTNGRYSDTKKIIILK
jgi:hypothetical protein